MQGTTEWAKRLDWALRERDLSVDEEKGGLFQTVGYVSAGRKKKPSAWLYTLWHESHHAKSRNDITFLKATEFKHATQEKWIGRGV